MAYKIADRQCAECGKEYTPTACAQKYCQHCKRIVKNRRERLYYKRDPEKKLSKNREWRSNPSNRERICQWQSEYNKLYFSSEHGRAKNAEKSRRYHRANAVKSRVRAMTRYIVSKMGLVDMRCELCGLEACEFHHTAYMISEPMTGFFVCKSCHARLHGRMVHG
jgi:hypothetical protein